MDKLNAVGSGEQARIYSLRLFSECWRSLFFSYFLRETPLQRPRQELLKMFQQTFSTLRILSKHVLEAIPSFLNSLNETYTPASPFKVISVSKPRNITRSYMGPGPEEDPCIDLRISSFRLSLSNGLKMGNWEETSYTSDLKHPSVLLPSVPRLTKTAAKKKPLGPRFSPYTRNIGQGKANK